MHFYFDLWVVLYLNPILHSDFWFCCGFKSSAIESSVETKEVASTLLGNEFCLLLKSVSLVVYSDYVNSGLFGNTSEKNHKA